MIRRRIDLRFVMVNKNIFVVEIPMTASFMNCELQLLNRQQMPKKRKNMIFFQTLKSIKKCTVNEGMSFASIQTMQRRNKWFNTNRHHYVWLFCILLIQLYHSYLTQSSITEFAHVGNCVHLFTLHLAKILKAQKLCEFQYGSLLAHRKNNDTKLNLCEKNKMKT